ncbi:MAG: TlpA family protein disulfide reductase, partial [Candidatus Brocadiae bacterium]|nr:TlpA family protein disulfide reductase [Candidatus Brocadiia bacterium]
VRAEHPVLGLPLAGWEPRRPVPPDHWRLIYLWASWIPACRDELPALAALARGREGLTALAVARVDVLQTEDEIRKVFAGAGEGLWLDLDDGSAARAFRAEDLPRVYLVDPDGEVRYSGRGSEVETLRAALQRWVQR